MEQFVSSLLESANGPGAYALIFGVLLLCGLGLPMPEDIALVTGGYLVFHQQLNLELMIFITYLGIIGGDSFIYFAGRFLGEKASGHWPFRKILAPDKRQRVEHLFAKYGQKIVMAARFMPGLRMPTYFIAGMARMGYFRFLFFDGLAALVSAPLFVYLGYRFGNNIEQAVAMIRRGEKVVIIAIVLIVAFYIGKWLWNRRRAQATGK